MRSGKKCIFTPIKTMEHFRKLVSGYDEFYFYHRSRFPFFNRKHGNTPERLFKRPMYYSLAAVQTD